MFLGKLLGAVFGYWMFGVYGAVAGLVLGFYYDKKRVPRLQHRRQKDEPLTDEEAERVRQSFFATTFSVMGHMAKADGQVRPAEIAVAESIMERLGLNAELRASAIALFNNGKNAGFDLDTHVQRFRSDCARSTSLYRVFLEIQIQAALADGKMDREEELILLRVAKILGFPEIIYRQIELLVRASMGLGDDHTKRSRQGPGYRRSQRGSAPPSQSTASSMRNSYSVLGVSEDANKAAVKTAYRKLMSQHHPDKLVSKGLPEEMLRIATDKTQQIQKAYEQIKTAKGW